MVSLRKDAFGGLLFVVVAALLLRSATSFAVEKNSAADKLDQIGWMQGSWTATVNGDYLDEFWSPPQGDSMIGMFRWNKKGTLWMCEMMTIVTEGENIVLRIKHFDRSLVGWEEKDKAVTLPLVKQSSDESVFERAANPQEKIEPLRLTYRKTGADSMDIILEEKEKGQDRRIEFHFTRLR